MNRLAISKGQFLSYASAVLISVFFVAAAVFGATTISTNIATDGTLSVSSAATFSAAVYASTTLGVTGAVDLHNTLAVTGNLSVNGFATTTAANGNIATVGTISSATSSPAQELSVVGDAFLGGSATTTLYLDSNGSGVGSCIQMRGATSSVVFRMYISEYNFASGTAGHLRVERGACQ